jgi:hypothetical protein
MDDPVEIGPMPGDGRPTGLGSGRVLRCSGSSWMLADACRRKAGSGSVFGCEDSKFPAAAPPGEVWLPGLPSLPALPALPAVPGMIGTCPASARRRSKSLASSTVMTTALAPSGEPFGGIRITALHLGQRATLSASQSSTRRALKHAAQVTFILEYYH